MSDYVDHFSRIEQLPDLLDGPTSSQINRVALLWASVRAVVINQSAYLIAGQPHYSGKWLYMSTASCINHKWSM